MIRYPIEKNELHKKTIKDREMKMLAVPFRKYIEGNTGVHYHYTSPTGLMGILQTRTLYFTDCEFLNDYRERIGINKALSAFWACSGKSYDKKFSKLLQGYHVENFEDDAYPYIDKAFCKNDPNEGTRFFVLSTSDADDSLNMWKYYAKDGSYDGYSIGLFQPALTDEWIDRETGVAIEAGYVIYDEMKKQHIIKEMVDCLYQQWCTYEMCEELNCIIIKEYKSWCSLNSLFFKDECFSEEKEYRYVAIVHANELKDLHYQYRKCNFKMYDFRLVHGTLVPYIKMPFKLYNVDNCWAVASVSIGPTQNERQKKRGLEKYIESLDYTLGNFEIRTSVIPLRY